MTIDETKKPVISKERVIKMKQVIKMENEDIEESWESNKYYKNYMQVNEERFRS